MRQTTERKERPSVSEGHSVPSEATGRRDGSAAAGLLLVEARNIARTFGHGNRSIAALVSATFQVEAGDRIAIVGSSGSGKSTLLHIVGGLDGPTTGSITWPALGRRSDLRPSKVGFVFQSPSLLPSLTVLENVALPLLLSGAPADVAAAAAHEALCSIALGDIEAKLPEELSGGQAQRAAFARALVCRPALVLADEPTGQLDARTAGHLFDVVLDVLDRSSTALVVATHDSAVARRMSRVWQMDHGYLKGAAR